MRPIVICLALAVGAPPAAAKQQPRWIETVAVLAVGQGICGVPLDNEAMQMAIGSAMITHALNKNTVIERARKRGHFIVSDVDKHKARKTFCGGFRYYLENGYPR